MKNRLLILEMQDGMMCNNDKSTVKMMIDKAIENKPDNMDMVFKWQLYTKIKTIVEVIPLDREIFDYAYNYARFQGFKTTASVFDKESFEFLVYYRIPFIKIACQTDLYDFRKDIHSIMNYDKQREYIYSLEKDWINYIDINHEGKICCIPKYPSAVKEYEDTFTEEHLKKGISDHTIGLELYNKYKPEIYEKHYYVDGLESWDKEWAIKPEELNLL